MRRRQHGLTLVELVMAVVIIAVAVTGVLLAYTQMVVRSADPLIEAQATAVAEAYMDEILAKPAVGPPSGGTRATFGSVGDYHGLSETPHDQFGAPMPGLGGYQVDVFVGSGGAPDDLGIGATPIRVTVQHMQSGGSVVLRAHKVDY